MTSDPVDILQLAEGIVKEKAVHLTESLAALSFYDLLKDCDSGRLKLFLDKNSSDYKNIEGLLTFLPSWKSRRTKEFELFKDSRPSTAKLLTVDKKFIQQFPFELISFKEIKFNYKNGKLVFRYSDSNNARRFDAIGDWVNVTYTKNGHHIDWVILTSKYGKCKGKRIVMGEVKESQEFYSEHEASIESL